MIVEAVERFARHISDLNIRPEQNIYRRMIEAGGMQMHVQQLTIAEARYIAALAYPRGGLRTFERKQCYMNSQGLMLESQFEPKAGNALEYCEGFVGWEGCPIPIGHAWLLLNNKVVDVTLRALSRRQPHFYYGIRVPMQILRRHMQMTRHYTAVIEGPLQARVFNGGDTRDETPSKRHRAATLHKTAPA